MLKELEPVLDVALVTSKDETSVMDRLPFLPFPLRHLRPKLDATPDDTVLRDRVPATTQVLEVSTRVRLADVSGEGAAGLRVDFALVAEVVVSQGIRPEGGIIRVRRDVDGSS